MTALEIVAVVAAVLVLLTLFQYLWRQLGWLGDRHSHVSPPHKHLDVPPHDHPG